MKKQFKIACSWEVYAVANVMAESLEQAIEKVEAFDFPLPSETNYVDGSFVTDYEVSKILNEERDKHEA